MFYTASMLRNPRYAPWLGIRGLGDDAPVTLSVPTNVGLTIQGFWPTLLFVGLAGIGVGALLGKVK